MKSMVVMLLFCLAGSAWAAGVPGLVQYEGYLSDAKGVPVKDSKYAVTFKIYETATGGSAIWQETWSSLSVSKGQFRVLLGSQAALTSAFFQQHTTTYLGITVGTNAEMLPRQRIASVPYALSAPVSPVPSGGIIMWSGAISAIPSGWAICDGANGTPDLRAKFILGAGGAYPANQTGGSVQINIAHSHTINDHTHLGVDHLHSINHQHYVARVNDGIHNGSGKGLSTGGDYSGYTGWYPQETTSSGAADRDLTTGPPSDKGMNSQLSATQSIMPPYYVLAYIMKL
jgi:hypothetical protein